MHNSRNKRWIFVGLCLVCAVALAAYFFHSVTARTRPPLATTSPAAAVPVLPHGKSSGDQPRQILYRYTGIDDNYAHYGKLALADIGNLDKPRFVDAITCQSVHFAAGRGLCLTANWSSLATYSAHGFDADFKELFTIPLKGSPSRVRVSPDGTLAGCTVFLTGHGYNTTDFSTETLLVDLAQGKVLASLDDLKVTRDGQPFKALDFNFWGVTFTPDSRRFYCTLSSNKQHYLVEADIASHTATVVHENVECPSVSPDGLRVAYKKRFTNQGTIIWQLHVLDLATKKETPLSEKRSVDDQLEWLDNAHVLYTVSENPEGSSGTTNVWIADAEGKAPPRLFLPKAFSPAVVR